MDIEVMKGHTMRTVLAAFMLSLLPALAAGQEGPRASAPAATTHTVEAGRSGWKWLIVGMIAAQAADIATTSVALHHGCVETTYYGLQSRWAISGMKATGTLVLSVTLPLAHHKKPKLTEGVAWAHIASGALGAGL